MSHRDTTVLFEEVQRLRAPWPRVLVSPGLWGGLIGLVWIVFHWIQHGALPWFAWVALPCGVLLVVLSLWMNWKLVLATRVEAGCVTVAMNRTTTFTWASCEIERCSQVAVKPWRDFSEWGHTSGADEKGGPCEAFVMGGKGGVQLVLAGGKTVVLGSRRPVELAEAIRRITGDA